MDVVNIVVTWPTKNFATESKNGHSIMKGPRMLLFEGILLFEALKEISARNPKWQKTHHATRSLGIEEHGYRKYSRIFLSSVGNIRSGTQFRTIDPSVDRKDGTVVLLRQKA